LLIGQSASDAETESGRNLESLLDEAWRVFRNREEEEDPKKDKQMLLAAL